MPTITMEEVKKLTKLLKKKKLKKKEVEVAGKLLTKFLIELVEVDRLEKEIEELYNEILKTFEGIKRVGG